MDSFILEVFMWIMNFEFWKELKESSLNVN